MFVGLGNASQEALGGLELGGVDLMKGLDVHVVFLEAGKGLRATLNQEETEKPKRRKKNKPRC